MKMKRKLRNIRRLLMWFIDRIPRSVILIDFCQIDDFVVRIPRYKTLRRIILWLSIVPFLRVDSGVFYFESTRALRQISMTILFELTRRRRRKRTIFPFYCQVSLFLYLRSCLEEQTLYRLTMHSEKLHTDEMENNRSAREVKRRGNERKKNYIYIYSCKTPFQRRTMRRIEKKKKMIGKGEKGRKRRIMQLQHTLCTEIIYIAHILVIINYCYCHR